MKDEKATFNNLFKNNETPLSHMEKEFLFEKIVKSGRKRRARQFIYNIGTVVLIMGIVTISMRNYLAKDAELDIVSISRKNKELVEGKSLPIMLSTDNKGLTLSVDSQQLISLQQEKTFHLDSSATSLQGYTTVYIPYGKRREVVLPDRSRVWLNAGSLLTFNNNMNESSRMAYLDGEGYFDISKRDTQFIIHTDKTTIRVLGTSFNFSSYSSDDYQTLDLLTGRILFESNTKDFTPLELKPGERIDFNFKRNNIHLNRNSQGDDILWTKKQLKLHKTSLRELFQKLEKIYNVEIIYSNHLTNSEPYSGRLNLDVDIITALKSIYELNEFKIELKERKVYIEK